jgi:type IV secretion system protein VirB1
MRALYLRHLHRTTPRQFPALFATAMAPELLIVIATCAPHIHVDTAARLIHHESGGHQFAIGVNGSARLSSQPTTERQAVTTAKLLIDRGLSVDMGYAQINSKNLRRLGLTVDEVFKPCANLAAMQTVLIEAYQRATVTHGHGQAALQAALSAYNTGNFKKGLQNGYVRALYRIAI